MSLLTKEQKAHNLKIFKSRPCGECKECCIVLSIDEPGLKKEGGEPCQHLCATGCSIYKHRPSICKRFHCSYQLGVTNTRPDKLGAYIQITNLNPVMVEIYTKDAKITPEIFKELVHLKNNHKILHMNIAVYIPNKKESVKPEEILWHKDCDLRLLGFQGNR